MLCIFIWLLGFGHSRQHSTGLSVSPGVVISVGGSWQPRILGWRVRRKIPLREAVAPCSPKDFAVGCSWQELLSEPSWSLAWQLSSPYQPFWQELFRAPWPFLALPVIAFRGGSIHTARCHNPTDGSFAPSASHQVSERVVPLVLSKAAVAASSGR